MIALPIQSSQGLDRLGPTDTSGRVKTIGLDQTTQSEPGTFVTALETDGLAEAPERSVDVIDVLGLASAEPLQGFRAKSPGLPTVESQLSSTGTTQDGVSVKAETLSMAKQTTDPVEEQARIAREITRAADKSAQSSPEVRPLAFQKPDRGVNRQLGSEVEYGPRLQPAETGPNQKLERPAVRPSETDSGDFVELKKLQVTKTRAPDLGPGPQLNLDRATPGPAAANTLADLQPRLAIAENGAGEKKMSGIASSPTQQANWGAAVSNAARKIGGPPPDRIMPTIVMAGPKALENKLPGTPPEHLASLLAPEPVELEKLQGTQVNVQVKEQGGKDGPTSLTVPAIMDNDTKGTSPPPTGRVETGQDIVQIVQIEGVASPRTFSAENAPKQLTVDAIPQPVEPFFGANKNSDNAIGHDDMKAGAKQLQTTSSSIPAQGLDIAVKNLTPMDPMVFAGEDFGPAPAQTHQDFALLETTSRETLQSQSMTSHKAELARATPVWTQVMDAARVLREGQIEVTLVPEELGRVRLTMTPSETGMTISIIAERSETLDLLKRNIEFFAEDLTSMGFESLAFEFGSSSPHLGENVGGRGDVETGQSDGTQNPLYVPTAPSPQGELDLRL